MSNKPPGKLNGKPTGTSNNDQNSFQRVLAEVTAHFVRQSAASPGQTFLLLRHGYSPSNKEARLCSIDREQDLIGITPEYVSIFQNSLNEAFSAQRLSDPKKITLYSSPLSRAKHSAEIVQIFLKEQHNRSTDLILDARITERNFGALDGQSYARWLEVKTSDLAQLDDCPHAAETPVEMTVRIGEFLLERASSPEQALHVVVSHADVLQITQLILTGKRVEHYSDIPYLEIGESRLVNPVRPRRDLDI